jgi:LAO/AO transport system kinase
VLTCSGLHGVGLDAIWEEVERHRQTLAASGELAAKRRHQQVDWTWTMVRDTLLSRLHDHPAVRAVAPELERQVRNGRITATLAAERILAAFSDSDSPD